MVGAGQTPSVLFLQNTHVAVLMYYGGLSAGWMTQITAASTAKLDSSGETVSIAQKSWKSKPTSHK